MTPKDPPAAQNLCWAPALYSTQPTGHLHMDASQNPGSQNIDQRTSLFPLKSSPIQFASQICSLPFSACSVPCEADLYRLKLWVCIWVWSVGGSGRRLRHGRGLFDLFLCHSHCTKYNLLAQARNLEVHSYFLTHTSNHYDMFIR